MAQALETASRKLFDAIDRKDAEEIIRAGTKDIQSVDELSRRWLRGAEDFGAYIRRLMNMVDDVNTTLTDVQETVSGDNGLMTCWMEQDYTLEGKRQHVSAPTTVAFRREGDVWKIALFHSIPLPAEEQS